MKIRCPHCGKPFSYSPSAPARSGVFESSHKLNNVAAVGVHPSTPLGMHETPMLPPGMQARRELPIFLPTFESNVQVPRGKAVTSALFAGPFWGIATGITTYIVGGPFWGVTGWQSIQAGFVVGLGAFFWVAWRRWENNAAYYDDLLLKIEEVTGMDLNQDGEIGEPERVDVNIYEDGGKRQHLEQWPVNRADLVRFAKAVISDSPNDTFSERTARECGLSREQFTFIRERFFAKHWATWKNAKNPRSGVRLRDSGLAVLTAIAGGKLPAGVDPQADDEGLMSGNYIERGSGQESWS